MKKEIANLQEMMSFAEKLGKLLCGGELIELVGDVGAGKTTFVKGLALGLEVGDNIQSPSFTINRTYDGRDNLKLSHYDFYRLESAGIMQNELSEDLDDKNTVTVIEWGEIVNNVLPDDYIQIMIMPTSDEGRMLDISARGSRYQVIIEELK